LRVPGVTADPHFGGVYCCAAGSALVVNVVYYDQCTPGVGLCNPVTSGLDSRYSSNGVPGGCTSWSNPSPTPCAHPSPPKSGPCPPSATCPGDSVVVTLTAAGAQVITPLVRPFFTKPSECPDSSSPSHCYVGLSSTVTMRFEGD